MVVFFAVQGGGDCGGRGGSGRGCFRGISGCGAGRGRSRRGVPSLPL